jgi:hypothetical protein
VISGIPKRRKITTRKHLTQAQIKDGMRQLCGHWIMFSAYVKEVKDTTNDYCVVECWDNSNKVSDKYFLTIEKEIALKLAKDHRVTFIGELVEIAENVNIEYKYPEKVETPYLEHAVRGAIFLNAIFYSIEVKSFELFKFFLDSGYNPDSQERNSRPGHTPIFDLVKLYDKNKFKTEEAIKLLVDHGANINAYYKQNFYIPAPSEESKGRFTEDNATVLDVVMNAKSAKIIDNNRIETHYKKKNDMRNLKIHETYRKPQFIEALRQFEARIRLLRSYGAKTYAEIQSGG